MSVVKKTSLVLGAGGPRSLVALARLKANGGPAPALVHVHDGRPAAAARLEHARRQADFFGVQRFHELKLPHLFGPGTAAGTDGVPRAALTAPQLLLAALQLAARRGYDELVWPACRGESADAVAVTLEQATLVRHLAQAERDLDPKHPETADAAAAIPVRTPFVELSAEQLLDLGQRAGASWALAWSCVVSGDRPCGACAGCRQRRRAFDRAGVVDPLEPSATGRSRRSGSRAA